MIRRDSLEVFADALNRGSLRVVLGAVNTRKQRGFELATEPSLLLKPSSQFLGLLVHLLDLRLLLRRLLGLAFFVLFVLVLTPDFDTGGRRVGQRRLPAPPPHECDDRLQQSRGLRRRVGLFLPHRRQLANLLEQREHSVQSPVASLALPQRPQHGGQRTRHRSPLLPALRRFGHLVQREPHRTTHGVAGLVAPPRVRFVGTRPPPPRGDVEQRVPPGPVVDAT